MADNVDITPGAGATVAADDVSSVLFQKIKLDAGGDGVSVPIVAGQQAAAGSLPVVLTAAQMTTLTPPAAITGFATEAKQDTQITAEQAILAKIIAAPATEAKQDTGNTSLGSIDTKLTSQATATKQDTGNASLASIDGKLPALGQALAAASVPVILPAATITTLTPPAAITGFATEAKQDTQITAEQAILAKIIAAPATEAKQDTQITSLSSIDGKLPALGQALAAASVPVILPSATITTLTPPAAITGFATAAKQPALGTAGTASADVISVQGIASMTPIVVKSNSYEVGVDITRPSDTTAYAALDVIGDTGGSAIFTFAAAGPSSSFLRINGGRLFYNINGVISGMAGWRVHFYNASPTAIADNAAFNLVSADRSKYLGYIDLGALEDLGDTLFAQADQQNKQILLVGGSTYYVQLQTRAAFTPNSADTLRLEIVGEDI